MPEAPSTYQRGSEWRRWDLQVHTPFSALNNGFGSDFEAYAGAVLRKAVDLEIAVIGLTDYFLIEGYRAMRLFLANGERLIELLGKTVAARARAITILPNVEMRSSLLVTHGHDTGRVNFHLIFDPALDPGVIEEHFLRELHFTAKARPERPDERWSLTKANLTDLGNRLKQEHAEFASESDLAVGMTNAVVSHEEVTEILHRQRSRFEGRYLFVVPADEDLSQISWNSQGHHARKLLLQKCHMLFSANPNTREFGLGSKHLSVDQFQAEFGDLKPCIHGSDAHTYDRLFEPDLKRYLWIKADPTFQGLRQLLFEPATRVFIGPEPRALARVSEGAPRYMESVSFERTPEANDEAVWFSGTLPLNPGLVAIIGNKGGGKSALADVLALVGNTRNSEYFSFLSSDRFLAHRTDLGNMFAAEVQWRSGRTQRRTLADPTDSTAPELVKFIPQGFLETICSELQESADTQFDRELKDVIFSHVADPDRLGQDNLVALIEHLTRETEELLGQQARRLGRVNEEIIALEAQQTEEHRMELEGLLAERRADLAAQIAARPSEVAEPAADPAQQQLALAAQQELESLVDKIETLDKQIEDAAERKRIAALRVAAADRLTDRLQNFERELEAIYAASEGDEEVLGLRTRAILSLAIDYKAIQRTKAGAVAEYEAADELLDNQEGKLTSVRQTTSAKANAARAKLDEPRRLYEEYRRNLGAWRTRCAEIEGKPDTTGSVKWMESRIASLAQLPAQIAERRDRRLKLVAETVDAKLRLLEKYQTLYAPVQTFIDEHPVAQQQSILEFSASLGADTFVDDFLNMIHQGRRGSFQGDREGRELLESLVATNELSSLKGIVSFLHDIETHLVRDRRGGEDAGAVRMEDQLRQGWSPLEVHNYLYGLGYLVPRFELLWQGKPLSQLSPGERGNLLLIFYLLIDKRSGPLIIDQPEENLDNHTITTTLIPAIAFAKERRQIVIVTHNPNLAVVCDAEQIIHAQIDKTAGNRVVYSAGGIEDPHIAQLVVDVLEGTKPAFDTRDAKYEVLERLAN